MCTILDGYRTVYKESYVDVNTTDTHIVTESDSGCT
jgi:hypothetical protein